MSAQPAQTIVLALTIVVMLVGLAGIVLPAVPGTILIFGAALAYAVFDGFQAVGWPTVVVLGVLMAVATSADIWATSAGARAGGASGWSLVAGFVGGVIGLVVFNLPGMMAGSVLGVLGAELLRAGDWRRAFKAGGGWLGGWLLSVIIQFVIGLVMIGIFYWQARGPR